MAYKAGPKEQGSEEADHQVRFDQERAEHERVKRLQREFELGVKQAQYLERAAVRQAAATVVSMFTQALRSLPDDLERECGLDVAVSELVAIKVDEALSQLATGLKALAPDV